MARGLRAFGQRGQRGQRPTLVRCQAPRPHWPRHRANTQRHECSDEDLAGVFRPSSKARSQQARAGGIRPDPPGQCAPQLGLEGPDCTPDLWEMPKPLPHLTILLFWNALCLIHLPVSSLEVLSFFWRCKVSVIWVKHGQNTFFYKIDSSTPITLGRGSSSTLCVADTHLSKVHCVLTPRSDGLHCRVLSEQAACYVNGCLVWGATLKHGDLLTVGKTTLCFSDSAESRPPVVFAHLLESAMLSQTSTSAQRLCGFEFDHEDPIVRGFDKFLRGQSSAASAQELVTEAFLWLGTQFKAARGLALRFKGTGFRVEHQTSLKRTNFEPHEREFFRYALDRAKTLCGPLTHRAKVISPVLGKSSFAFLPIIDFQQWGPGNQPTRALYFDWPLGRPTSIAMNEELLTALATRLSRRLRLAETRETSRPASLDQKTQSIVHIDDCKIWRRVMTKALSPLFDFHSFGSWASAFSHLTKEQVDLLILDVELPGLKGPEIAHAYRSVIPEGSLLLISSLGDAELAGQARACGANGWISKRMSLARIRAEVSRLI